MLAETLKDHRLFREPPDYSQEGAPDANLLDYAKVEFYKTAFPADAFDVWRMYRTDLCDRTGLGWQELNSKPECLTTWSASDVVRCYPDTAKECPAVRVLKSPEAVAIQHSVFVDSARLFYKYPTPIKSVFLSEIGDFMFNTKTSPQCLMIRIDSIVASNNKLYQHIKNLLTRYIKSGKKLVFVFDTTMISTDPFDVKDMAYDWVEF